MLDKQIIILQKIIDADGSCAWMSPTSCTLCPLGHLKRRSDGTFLSCVDGVGINSLTASEANIRIKEAAKVLLTIFCLELLLKRGKI
jgi:hypothetical protein